MNAGSSTGTLKLFYTSFVKLAFLRKSVMSRSLPVIAALSVVMMGLWHIYAAHHAELSDMEFGIVNTYKQAELVARVGRTQEVVQLSLGEVSGLKQKARETDALLENLQRDNERLHIRTSEIALQTTKWRALKDTTEFSVRGFMSKIKSRGNERGPPELFEFPSSISQGRVLCFQGNDTSNGTKNTYAFAWEDALPSEAILLNGTTLVSETAYDHNNPWHSMYNLVQFVSWKLAGQCQHAERLILFHQSELRRTMGEWITQIFTAAGLPAQPYEMATGDRPICFERAIVSRLGMGGVTTEIFRELYAQIRCQVRTLCALPVARKAGKESCIQVTLMVRSGAREWKDQKAWERVVADQCGKVEGCQWTSMYVANMTFCEQIKSMMETDILVSVHGAQLTNMIFMSPGGRILEAFPRGWLELAGGGQYIYRQLALWNGLVHEGYWRDPLHQLSDCPYKHDNARCMTFYKDQSVGINETYVSTWLGGVLDNFKSVKLADESAGSDDDSRGDHRTCRCVSNGSSSEETSRSDI